MRSAKAGDPEPSRSVFEQRWSAARSIADRESFLHWEVAFPGVWRRWQDARPEGGFDAVIGNPPWDRIKLQEVEWFATRAPSWRCTDRGRPEGPPSGGFAKATRRRRFDAARPGTTTAASYSRRPATIPLLGGRDVNLYSLFVERAMSLIKPDGFVGLLTPSGIYADKTAANFFKSVSTSGRVAGLFDFENRRLGTDLPPFFPDVDSRFKFCALVFGGEDRRFDQTRCAFFLHDTRTIDDPERGFTLAPADFSRVNPNTGTAPVFRTRRDAEITRRIYERHPVLVDRSQGESASAWPICSGTVQHDVRLASLPDFGSARRRGFLPGPGQPLEEGR